MKPPVFKIGKLWKFQMGPERIHEYTCGSIEGICSRKDGWLVIIAMVNQLRGNGHFKAMMDQVEKDYDVRVVGFFNPTLRDHFLQKRGYVEVRTDGSDAVEHRRTPETLAK